MKRAGASSYQYNASNELSSTSLGNYTYDANGNILSDASGKSYTWDFENRLTQAIVPGVGTISFHYDPFGRRIYKQSPNATGVFLYDGDDLLETVNGSGADISEYARGLGIDEPLAIKRVSTTDYYEQDGLRSITSLTNTNGSVGESYSYDTFGGTTNSSGTVTNFFRYAGREFDTQTGLYYYRARYYDPGAGRFISEDPSGLDAGDNFYEYAENNPVNLADPMGLAPVVPLPPVSSWTAAEEAAYQVYVQALQGTSTVLSNIGTGLLIAGYMLNPSSSNNAQWANSSEAQFERLAKEPCDKNEPDCTKASPWQLAAAEITDPHQFKEDILGKGAKKSSFDICACKDGSIVLKAVGKCGKPGGSIETGHTWK